MVKNLDEAGSGYKVELAGLVGVLEMEGRAQPRPCVKAESWKHSSISWKLEKALELFSSEFLALHCRLRVIFDFL